MSRYEEAFQIIVGHEGGYGADPRDRGNWTSGVIGKGVLKGTKYGIAAHAYPQLDIKNLTLEQARAIYKRDYWDKIGGDNLPAPLALAAFDTAVNSGVGRARQFLSQTTDWRRFLDIRQAFLRNLPTWETFGRGWQKRLDTLRQQCAAWETNAPAKVILIDGGGNEVVWDGKNTKYGGLELTPALVEQLRTVYSVPGGPWQYQAVKVYRRKNGDLVLEKPR